MTEPTQEEIDAILEGALNLSPNRRQRAWQLLSALDSDLRNALVDVSCDLTEGRPHDAPIEAYWATPFDNLLSLSDRAVQTLLHEVSRPILVAALQGTSDQYAALLSRNMSSRSWQLLSEDLQQPRYSQRKVGEARLEIMKAVARLRIAGEIEPA